MKITATLIVALLGAFACTGPALAADRPNVILVMTDDQGYGDIGAHGNKLIQTPHLDRFHGQSVRFTNFHVDPTCSETRAALMTGRYSSRTGVWHTIMGRSILRADETTMAQVFADSGYATGMFGKWHLGDTHHYLPENRGFQHVVRHGGGGVGQTPDYWGNDYFGDTYWVNGEPTEFDGYCTDVWFDEALKFIEKHKGGDKPFFAYIATNAPHGPFLVDEKYEKIYTDKGVKGAQAKFWGMITNIDENFGRLVGKLDEWGLTKNTIVVFMTDNGTAAGDDAGMRGRKGSQYEGGHRVPCFVRWPGGNVGTVGRDVPHLTAHIDLLPTFIDVCGLKKPQGVEFDGGTLAPLLKDDALVEFGPRTLFVHSQRIDHPEKWRKCSVMTQRWRLVDGKELYDITKDPGQKNDVADEHPQVVAELRKAYEGWWDDISDRFDEYVRIVIGDEGQGEARLTGHDWHADIRDVPWHQNHIRNEKLHANGRWAIEIARHGKYRFELRRWPRPADGPIEATVAQLRLKNDDREITDVKPVKADAKSAVFEVGQLPPGRYWLHTELKGERDGKTRGAYYVYAKRVE